MRREADGRWIAQGLLAALFLLSAGGCGFHLRGSLGELEALPPVLVRGDGDAAAELTRALRSAGSPVVEDAAQARLVVTIVDARRDRRASAVGTTGRVQEYELHYAVRFRVDDPAGANLAPEQTVAVQRSYAFDGTDVNAKSNEEADLYRDMEFDAMRQILMRLQAIHPDAPAPDGAGAAP
ncbi:MAG: LPS assembly lipoprotein LptE [Gammaproteobacteria bacterium]